MQEYLLPWLEWWRKAYSQRFGIVLAVSDAKAAKTLLYLARQKLGDPVLADLQIRTSPDNPENELWIIKSDPKKDNI